MCTKTPDGETPNEEATRSNTYLIKPVFVDRCFDDLLIVKSCCVHCTFLNQSSDVLYFFNTALSICQSAMLILLSNFENRFALTANSGGKTSTNQHISFTYLYTILSKLFTSRVSIDRLLIRRPNLAGLRLLH